MATASILIIALIRMLFARIGREQNAEKHTEGRSLPVLIEKSKREQSQLLAIQKLLGPDELLGQATEECCELGQALQKLRRALKGTTPVTTGQAMAKMDEEAGDVMLLLDCLEDEGLVDLDAARESARQKLRRWYGRTFGGE